MNTLPSYLQARTRDRRASQQGSDESKHLIVCSEDDTGVMLNGGRLGARLGPRAVLACFHQMIASLGAQNHQIIRLCPDLKREHRLFDTDFNHYQQQQIKNLETCVNQSWTKLVHLGGGHDHIYPLLCSLEKSINKPLFIINLDAHLDTRTDTQHHSGTPFRQFSKNCLHSFQLLQVGIHSYANPKANEQPLNNGLMEILSPPALMERLEKEDLTKYQVVLSLDADALDCSVMEAVSAVNPQGLRLEFVQSVIDYLNSNKERYVFGVYEYNPLYDNLSQKGAKTLALLIDQVLQ
jgi:formiminoglutamase